MPLRLQLTDRSRLILVALAVAILTMLAILLLVLYVPAESLDRVQGKWVRFAVMTGFLVLFSLNSYWPSRKSLGFWGIFLSFLALHVLGVGHVWAIHNGLSMLTVGLVGGAEWVCMAFVIYWVLGVGPNLGSKHPRSPWIPKL